MAVVAYTRISRDDEGKSPSIANQIKRIKMYAEENHVMIDKWYSDDNYSGFSFTRPDFDKVKAGMKSRSINTIIAVDSSRIGRNLIEMLVFTNEAMVNNIRLIYINENYDSLRDGEDEYGPIRYFFNERWIKETSKKIRSVTLAKQRKGELKISLTPFGFIHDPNDKLNWIVSEREASIVKEIFRLYLCGYGYRKIQDIMNEKNINTPAQYIKEREGVKFKNHIASEWSTEMVRDILKNDSYIGILRQHKRARKQIGKNDLRVPKEEQFVFYNHHEAIIEQLDFDRAQEMMVERIRTDYRGQRKNSSIFSSVIRCKDCGARMNLVCRNTRGNTRYFVCKSYNAKGTKSGCSSHHILEREVKGAVMQFLRFCGNVYDTELKAIDLQEDNTETERLNNMLAEIEKKLGKLSKLIETALAQRISDLVSNTENNDIIERTFKRLLEGYYKEITQLEKEKQECLYNIDAIANVELQVLNAKEVLDRIISNDELTASDVNTLIESIDITSDKSIEINFRYGFKKITSNEELFKEYAKKENQELKVLYLILGANDQYTSLKYIRDRIKNGEAKMTVADTRALMKKLTDNGILIETSIWHKPYEINREKLREYIKELEDSY